MNNWEIIDNNGVIHSGTEEEMIIAFEAMTNIAADDRNKWGDEWNGDLKLIEVHNIEK